MDLTRPAEVALPSKQTSAAIQLQLRFLLIAELHSEIHGIEGEAPSSTDIQKAKAVVHHGKEGVSAAAASDAHLPAKREAIKRDLLMSIAGESSQCLCCSVCNLGLPVTVA